MENSSDKSNKSDGDNDISLLEKTITPNNIKRFKKPRGLKNLGNTCYFNAVLQCLTQTPFLKQFLLETSKPNPPLIMKLDNEDIIMNKQIWSTYLKLFYLTLNKVDEESEIDFTPDELLYSLRKTYKIYDIGNKQQQHDSHEILHSLLNRVYYHDALRHKQTIIHHYGYSVRFDKDKWESCPKINTLRKKINDLILCPEHIFNGKLLIVNQCQTCGHKSEKIEKFIDLSLPITIDKKLSGESTSDGPKEIIRYPIECDYGECSIITCLNKFTAFEIMTGNDKIKCQQCTEEHEIIIKKKNYRQYIKKIYINSPPAILILHLKRYKKLSTVIHKIDKHVMFPWVLDIAPYCSVDYQNKLNSGQNQILYALYGVVEHSGLFYSGHYQAYIKVRDLIKDDSYRFSYLEGNNNKPSTTFIDDNNNSSNLSPNGVWYRANDSIITEVTPNEVQSSNAYLLFYERIL